MKACRYIACVEQGDTGFSGDSSACAKKQENKAE